MKAINVNVDKNTLLSCRHRMMGNGLTWETKIASDSTATFARLQQELGKAENEVLQESRRIDRNLAEAVTWRDTTPTPFGANVGTMR